MATGVLRASHRTLGRPPYLTGGVPWATHRRADAQPLDAGVPVPLRISLSATAFALRSGDMVRVAVSSRDPRDIDAPVPMVSLYADAEHPSSIEIPEVDTSWCTLSPELTPGRILNVRPLGSNPGGAG
jgi:predicted acyl esterase